MEEYIITTRDEMVKAFKLWAEDSENYPEEYNDPDTSQECAEKSADLFLEFLEEVKKK